MSWFDDGFTAEELDQLAQEDRRFDKQSEYCPTPERIRAACEVIQAGWSSLERRHRKREYEFMTCPRMPFQRDQQTMRSNLRIAPRR